MFDAVSIKRNTAGFVSGGPPVFRPDGSITLTNVPVSTLIARAYPRYMPLDMVGLPGWVPTERYDVSTTSPLTAATPEQAQAMLRTMLADRFKLAVHVEQRPTPVYELMLARRDGRLGNGLARAATDCDARSAAPRPPATTGPPTMPDLDAPPPPCTLRSVGGRPGDKPGDRLEGDTTMDRLATFLRLPAGRLVLDRTGLTGWYHVTMTYDRAAALRPADAAPPDVPPSVFTALPEQLGLKLEPARADRETLVIDRLERPTEN